jgi:curved DNA-binding protein CbpA
MWTATRAPWEVLGVGPGATPDEVRTAFRRVAKRSHPDALHASLEGLQGVAREKATKRGEERFRIAMSAYEMYDLKSGRWRGSLIKPQQQRPARQYTHEPPPFDLRRFSAPRLHPKTRAAVMGLYLCVTVGLALESFARSRAASANSARRSESRGRS